MKHRAFKKLFRMPALLLLALIGVWAGGPSVDAGGPQNIILMIGDGMGLESVWAAGAFQFGAEYHKFGGRERLGLEKLAGFAWVTTYPLNLNTSPTNDPRPLVSYDPTWTRGGKPGQLDYPRFGPELAFNLPGVEGPGNGNGENQRTYATDSGSSATSLACGIKTYVSAIGMDNFNRPCKNIVEKFHEKGKKAGIITSVPFSHATPAAFGAHNVNRKNYWAIAEEMIRVVQPEVVMGAGHPGFDGYGSPVTPQYKYLSAEDYRLLNREGAGAPGPYFLLEKQEDFLGVLTGTPPARVFGLAQNSQGLKQKPGEGAGNFAKTPSLKEMTRGALRVLAEGGRGFFLMVEGGAIDHGHHRNDLNLAVGETLRFQEAVQAVVDWIENPGNPQGGWDKNLLIVTADHETGYLTRIEPRGQGAVPGHNYYSKDHTNRLVGVWYQGAGMEFFQKYLKNMNDFERGPLQFLDNTEIHKVMEDCLQAEPENSGEKKELSFLPLQAQKAA